MNFSSYELSKYYNKEEIDKLVKGVVQKIWEKDYNGATLYSISLKGDDNFYRAGENKPTVGVGEAIQFDVRQVGRNLSVTSKITPWTEGPVETSPAVPGSQRDGSSYNSNVQPRKGGGFVRGTKTDEEKGYWDQRQVNERITQRRIEIQAARNAAIETAKLAIQWEAIPAPKKSGDKLEALTDLVGELMDEYLGDTQARIDGTTKSQENSVVEPVKEEVF